MERSRLVLLISRALQILCAIVVLATSIKAVRTLSKYQKVCNDTQEDKNCNWHHVIGALGFGAAAGAYGLLEALVGLAAMFMNAIPYIIMLGLDALAALAYLAAGVAIAVTYGHNQGWSGSPKSMTQADAAFNFLGVIVTAALIAMGFFWGRPGGKVQRGV